jgi:hypothetical protein
MWSKTTKCVKRNNGTRYEPDRVTELSYRSDEGIRRTAYKGDKPLRCFDVAGEKRRR